jgi:hypothetical protein
MENNGISYHMEIQNGVATVWKIMAYHMEIQNGK